MRNHRGRTRRIIEGQHGRLPLAQFAASNLRRWARPRNGAGYGAATSGAKRRWNIWSPYCRRAALRMAGEGIVLRSSDDREGQDRRPVLRDLAQVDSEGRVKNQERQKDDEKNRSAERQIDDRRDDVVEESDQRRVEQERREAADRNADDRKEHGIRQMEPLRGGLDQAAEDQKPGNDQVGPCDADQLPVS